MSCELLPSHRPTTPTYPRIVFYKDQWHNYPSADTYHQGATPATGYTGNLSGFRCNTPPGSATSTMAGGDEEPSRKRPKVNRTSTNFRRKSLQILRMFSPDRSGREEPADLPSARVHRSVSDYPDGVVIRRHLRGSSSRSSIATTSSTLTTDSAMVTSTPKPSSSSFHHKFRRLSASVKNFSLEKIMHQKKYAQSTQETVERDSLLSSLSEHRKSLPADFRDISFDDSFLSSGASPFFPEQVGIF